MGRLLILGSWLISQFLKLFSNLTKHVYVTKLIKTAWFKAKTNKSIFIKLANWNIRSKLKKAYIYKRNFILVQSLQHASTAISSWYLNEQWKVLFTCKYIYKSTMCSVRSSETIPYGFSFSLPTQLLEPWQKRPGATASILRRTLQPWCTVAEPGSFSFRE